MPCYQYEYLDEFGKPTGETFEYIQRMKDDALTVCPKTNRPVRRQICVPQIIIDAKKPKTIGALAEKNTEKMIKRGDPRIRKKKPNPFWRPNKNKVDKDLAKMNKKQKLRYIKTGEKS